MSLGLEEWRTLSHKALPTYQAADACIPHALYLNGLSDHETEPVLTPHSFNYASSLWAFVHQNNVRVSG
jgi:hypothetical protein